MAKWKVAIIDIMGPEEVEIARRAMPPDFDFVYIEKSTQEEQIEKVKGADYVIGGSMNTVPAPVIEAMDKARLIQKSGIGYDRIHIPTAERLGIGVAITAGANRMTVSEFTIALILSVYKWIPQSMYNMIQHGKWRDAEMRANSHMIQGKVVGLVGFGNIGQAVAQRLRGFETREVLYYDVVRQRPEREQELGVRFVPSLDDLIPQCDIVSLHVPHIPATTGMFGGAQIALMKPSAILINTCRGAVVDESALYEALRDRKIAGAGLDVFMKEPATKDNPLFSLPNVVVTPHIAGSAEELRVPTMEHMWRNIHLVAHGHPLPQQDVVLPIKRPL
ncbi:MAG: 2-hydroxyacid dehydrogenase [Bacteroidetes bacterium]|nr:2-hydroxyacid dehydrogenase [Bacteroidota bacterium]MCL5025134.1 2-hydroxyacid dehydrogenase [Chloroflexota bacterium]